MQLSLEAMYLINVCEPIGDFTVLCPKYCDKFLVGEVINTLPTNSPAVEKSLI